MQVLAVLASLLLVQVISIQAGPSEDCKPKNVTYRVPDDKFCDKYHDCGTDGKFTERLCRDGYDFATDYSQCDFPHKVVCGKRTERQPPQSANPRCHRLYGLYPYDPKVSCSKFDHCQDGVANEKECAAGIIFDPSVGTCVHPDTANRPGCSATEVLKFTCPNKGNKFAKLRYFDHDRLSHPEDCRQYFTCGKEAQPRIYGCPHGKVFYEKSGRCIKASKHPDSKCQGYYGPGGLGENSHPDEDLEDEDFSSEENEAGSKSKSKDSKKKSSQ